MMMKNTCLIGFLIALSFGKMGAQVGEVPNSSEWETAYDDQESIIDISPAELQSLLEKIMQLKRKRLQQLSSERTALDNKNNDNNTSNPNDLLEKKDLENLQSNLEKEIASLRKTIEEFSLNPAPILAPTPPSGKDSTYQKAATDYYREYATQMIELRQSVDRLEAQWKDRQQQSDYAALEKQLYRIEAKINTTTTAVATEKDTTHQQQNRPITESTASVDLNAQLLEMRDLIAQLKKQQLQETPTAPTNEPLDQQALMAQWNAQFDELREMVQQIQPTVNTEKERIVTEAAPPDTAYNALKRIISGKEKRQLLYANNATSVTSGHLLILQETASLILQNEKLDILIAGFTSEKGAPLYNQSLSQNRAEAVKKYLILQGIHPGRIFTEYHGIDYETKAAPQGRRVDLVFLIRR